MSAAYIYTPYYVQYYWWLRQCDIPIGIGCFQQRAPQDLPASLEAQLLPLLCINSDKGAGLTTLMPWRER